MNTKKNIFFLWIMFFAVFFLALEANAMSSDSTLSKYHWKNRLLLVFTPDDHNQSYRDQLAGLTSREAGTLERDMVIIELIGDQIIRIDGIEGKISENQAIRNFYRVSPVEFKTILVGKDGGEKIRSSQSIPVEQIFSTIDAMPMRQSEMRERAYLR